MVKAINVLLGMKVKRRPAALKAGDPKNVNAAQLHISDQDCLLDIQDAISGPLSEPFYPFKIYNVPQEFCPPADPANNYDPAVDAYRTFQVRMGICSYRSAFFSTDTQLSGGWNQAQYPIIGGSDGQQIPTDAIFEIGNADFESSGSEVIYVADTGIAFPTDSITCATWVLPKTVDIYGELNAAWWIEWVDNIADGFFAVIKCQMWTDAFAEPRPESPFPDSSSNIVPLGFVKVLPSNTHIFTPGVTQYVTSNLTDRYSPPVIPIQGGPMMYRGNWDDDVLSGQFFFRGDVVAKDDTIGPDLHQRVWIYNHDNSSEASPPSASHWRIISDSILV